MLVRLWRKEDPSALLVGMQAGPATVENSVEFPQKIKIGTDFEVGFFTYVITVTLGHAELLLFSKVQFTASIMFVYFHL